MHVAPPTGKYRFREKCEPLLTVMYTRIAEVIESTSTGFVAGAYELLAAPPFGALVRAQARAEGMLTMYEDGIQKVLKGQTTIEEVLRVTPETEKIK